jgi:hypothetical protein
MTDLAAGVEEYKATRREESKASKKRRAQRKWDAMATKNTNIGCPVRRDVLVAARLRDGTMLTKPAGELDWRFDMHPGTIVSYKVLERNKHKPKPEGAWIEWKSPKGYKWSHETPGWYGPAGPGVMVDVKQRNGKETYNIETGTDIARGAFWLTEDHENDIVAYRIVKRKEATKTVTQEEMVDALADSIGKPLAIPVDRIHVGRLSAVGDIDVGTLTSGSIREAANTVLEFHRDPAPDTNPKKQYGVQSVPLNMWSPLASAYGALGLYNGSLKYGKANFANTPVEASIYIAAAMRHLNAWAAGEEFDPADGVPNLGGVLANIAILLEARAAGTLIDDRLKMSGYLKERDALKDIVKNLNELHAGKAPKHYTLDQ